MERIRAGRTPPRLDFSPDPPPRLEQRLLPLPREHMPNESSRRAELAPVVIRRTLADRVRDRVAEVATQIEGAPSTKPKVTKPKGGKSPAAKLNSVAERELRSLLLVYREMKTTYQGYRKETGRPSVPELKEAVHAFTKGPSLTSLVGVAAFLEDRNLLAW